jgi:hypothetical protein
MYCPRCAHCNRPEALRCQCGQVMPLARSLQFVPGNLPEYSHELRAPRTRNAVLGTLCGAALGFVCTLLALPVAFLVCFFLTCGGRFVNWDRAPPWILLGSAVIGGLLGCLRVLRGQ